MTFLAKLAVVPAAVEAAVASPSGLGSGQVRFAIFGADGSLIETKDVDGQSAEFPGLTVQPSTATAILLDTAGTPLFDAVTSTFTDGDAPAAPVDPVNPAQPAAVMVTPLASLSATFTTE